MGLALYELAAADPALRFSPHCWKVRMALRHKQQDVEGIAWRFTQKAEIAFSGQTTVPVLIDGEEVVSDSWCIALYLERRFPDLPSLFPGEKSVALVRFVNAWSDGTLLAAIARIILTDIYACLDPIDQDYFRSSREKLYGATLEDVVADGASNLAALKRTLTPLRQTLKGQAFISGAEPAYADFCVFGMFMWARSCSAISLLTEEDSVYIWRERMLDAYDGYARQAPGRGAS